MLNRFGAEYFIDWKRLARGCSFFLPTTATASQVRQALRPHTRKLNVQFEVRARCEYGRYGVRVWRVF
ncbi:MAG TPA: hypothetical protein VLA31_04755 [Burkholderiaceae bacterium]|nr:hypothetical protein [Burkholderiaceae bacterium]